MQLAIEIVGYGAIVPAVISIAVAAICRRCLPKSIARRYGYALAMAFGFVVGYVLVPSPADIIPQRNWHWLPYLAICAAVVGPIGLARGVWVVERWLLILFAAIVAACLLVPHWASLQPARSWYVGFLSLYLFVLAAWVPPLADRVSHRVLLGSLAAAAIVLAAMILDRHSLIVGQVAEAGAAALVGCCVSNIWQQETFAVRALVPVFSLLVGGLAFVGYVEPDPRLSGLLIIPASPLILWMTASLPLPEGRMATVVHAGAVTIVLCVGVVLVLLRS